MDIITTSPKHLMKEMEEEAAEAKQEIAEFGRAHYWRNTLRVPKNLNVGDAIWYVEDGYIRGFATVVQIQDNGKNCMSYILSDAASWTWIRPIPYKGFQGWRYFDVETCGHELQVVGDYLAPRPEVD